MPDCITKACHGLVGELYLTGKGWVTFCPVCRGMMTAKAVTRKPDEADRLAAEGHNDAITQEYAKAEEKLMQAAEKATDGDRRQFYLWYALLCRYGVYYVREVLYETLPAKRTNRFNPTFGRFPLPDYKIRKCAAYKQLTAQALPGKVLSALNELYVLLCEIEDCIDDEANRYQIFIAWHDRQDDEANVNPCRTFANKLNDKLNARRMFSFASFSALNEITVAHYEPYIYVALATARVMVIVIDDYNALGKKFLKSEIERFLTRRRDDRNLQIYFVGLERHVGEVPASLTGISGWQKHIEDARDDEHCYARVVSELQRLLERRAGQRSVVQSVTELAAAPKPASKSAPASVPRSALKSAPVQQQATTVNTFAALHEKINSYNRAVQLMANRQYKAASAAFIAAGDYLDAVERINEPYYVQAEQMLENGDFDGASAMFAALGEKGFRDAGKRAGEVLYRKGWKLYVEHNYSAAHRAYIESSNMGNVDAIMDLGNMYRNGKGVRRDNAEAVKWYRRAAEMGNTDAMMNLGDIYRIGKGVKRDNAEAVRWYRKAAEAGDAEGMYYIGYLSFCGKIVDKDYVEAYKWIQRSVKAGYVAAMSIMGLMYEKGYCVNQDYSMAVDMYWKAAEAGDTDGMCGLGNMYFHGYGVERNDEAAFNWYEKAAEAGNIAGMYNLGIMYGTGRGVDQSTSWACHWFESAVQTGNQAAIIRCGDMWFFNFTDSYGMLPVYDDPKYDRAVEWYRKAADAGDTNGMNSLGMMYEMGLGVSQNYAEAVKWYRKAADAGNALGMGNLGWMYRYGYGVKQDNAEAVNWYRKAADAGNVVGMCGLGDMYRYGYGVKQDDAEAVSWYKKAASANYADGMYRLGVMYRYGHGVEQDDAQAVHWYKKAASAGHAFAMYDLGWMAYHDKSGVTKDLNVYEAFKNAYSSIRRAFHEGSKVYGTGQADEGEQSAEVQNSFHPENMEEEASSRRRRFHRVFQPEENRPAPHFAKEISSPGYVMAPFVADSKNAFVNNLFQMSHSPFALDINAYGLSYGFRDAVWTFDMNFKRFRYSVEMFDPADMNTIGDMYYYGKGFNHLENAKAWYSLATEFGNAAAMYNLAWMYKYHVKTDTAKKTAEDYYRKAEEAGYSVSRSEVIRRLRCVIRNKFR